MESPVDSRAIKAMIWEIKDKKRYVVPFTAVLTRLKGLTEDDGEAYELSSELYKALNEGRIRHAYLIGTKRSRIVLAPVELTSEQLLVLREVGRVYTVRCLQCPEIPNENSIDAVVNALVDALSTRDNLVPSPALAVYVLAKNNGLGIQRVPFGGPEEYKYGSHDIFKSVEAFKIEDIVTVVRTVSVDSSAREMWVFW
jgi:hypothetical protein